ncbi:hypothetical protein TcG_05768 [Trypanosoma cruzi]|nr:hypothetical protein TcG_05768 [Trypanosoma cruzi]
MSCSTSHTSASRFSQYCATSLAQKIDVQRQSGLPLPKFRRSPHRTAQPHKIGLRLHALRQSRVIRVEFFQRRKLLHALRKENNDGTSAGTHLPLRVLPL